MHFSGIEMTMRFSVPIKDLKELIPGFGSCFKRIIKAIIGLNGRTVWLFFPLPVQFGLIV